MTNDDKHLIRYFRQGSAEALAEIYDRYVGLLVKVAGGLLNDRQAAEDVVHDTFVKLAQSNRSLRLEGSLKAYLITCVTNRARDRLRKKSLDVTELDGQAITLKTPPEAMMDKEICQLIQQALVMLPSEQREVIVLHVQAEITFREIAGMLNISENTAQSRYRYGMEKLKMLFNGKLMS